MSAAAAPAGSAATGGGPTAAAAAPLAATSGAPVKPAALSVSQALRLARGALEQIAVTIVGEVSEFTDKPGYKALYFTLADEQSALPCVMWRNVFAQAQIAVDKGKLVEATGVFTLYAAKGRMNFEVRSIRLAGEGELRLRVAALAARLEAEGLMAPERKRPLPEFPLRIGVVTSPRGKAVHDVLRTLRRRFPLAQVLLAGVAVEGEGAASAMVSALAATVEAGAELVLLVRGGGSYEDLMPFNDEALARAVAACKVPVVTGIGHEPDNSIADMVASVRCSTPTAAAERVSPDAQALIRGFEALDQRLGRALGGRLAGVQARLAELGSRPVLTDPHAHLNRREFALELSQMRLSQMLATTFDKRQATTAAFYARLQAGVGALLATGERRLGIGAAKLESLSPLAVLARGYGFARDAAGRVVASVDAVDLGEHIGLRLRDGSLACTVYARMALTEDLDGDGRKE